MDPYVDLNAPAPLDVGFGDSGGGSDDGGESDSGSGSGSGDTPASGETKDLNDTPCTHEVLEKTGEGRGNGDPIPDHDGRNTVYPTGSMRVAIKGPKAGEGCKDGTCKMELIVEFDSQMSDQMLDDWDMGCRPGAPRPLKDLLPDAGPGLNNLPSGAALAEDAAGDATFEAQWDGTDMMCNYADDPGGGPKSGVLTCNLPEGFSCDESDCNCHYGDDMPKLLRVEAATHGLGVRGAEADVKMFVDGSDGLCSIGEVKAEITNVRHFRGNGKARQVWDPTTCSWK